MLVIPFIMKYLVDGMNLQAGAQLTGMVALGLVLAYGLARFSSVLFGELRDTLFGRVTERAMRNLGLKVFRHVHALDLDFHLIGKQAGIFRDAELRPVDPGCRRKPNHIRRAQPIEGGAIERGIQRDRRRDPVQRQLA